MPHTPSPGCCSNAPVGGDPAKPGAWTQAQINDWNRVKNCDHVLLGPRDESCARCGTIVRPNTTEPDYETIAENRRQFDEESTIRSAENAYERQLGL